MSLRTRLFWSISALITVALLGLLLGVTSVMQMARNQEQLILRNFAIIDTSQKLRQSLGDQLVILISEHPEYEKLETSRKEFEQALSAGLTKADDTHSREAYRRIEAGYEAFRDVTQQPLLGKRWTLLEDTNFGKTFNQLRKIMIDVQQEAIDKVSTTELASRERAKLVAVLLGLVGVAILLIGFITAHSIARRFGAPIEALARAADQIGQGDYKIVLPISPVAEMARLSRRFGIMADALQQFKNNNIEALAAGQLRLQSVLDSIDDGMVIVDQTGRLEHLNSVAQRQLAWNEDHNGEPLGLALQRPELDEQLRLVLQGASLDKAVDDLALEIEGEVRLLAYRLTPVVHDEHNILGAVMVLRDVTEQRAFERVRNEFVLRASHELRTPVTGMRMAFGLLHERLNFAENTREADLLETVDGEMERLMQLITDLLNFSRYQSGLQKLDLRPSDLQEVLNECRRRFIDQAEDRDIILVCEFEEDLPQLELDRLQIDRVMDNLLSNALRHSPDHSTIRLFAQRNGDRVIISVEDKGEGIPRHQQARIFEPFVQVGRKQGGAGLGLALCEEIIRLHGGRIGVYSRPGHGSQFYVTLPVQHGLVAENR